MADIVEVVAKAIGGVLDDLSDERNWPGFRREMARAAIEAMREPSEAMVAAVGSDWGPQMKDNWDKMINAALADS